MIVVDSSVTLALVLEDEFFPFADVLIDELAREGSVVPAHWSLETANALLMALKRGRIAPDKLLFAFESLDRYAPDIDTQTHIHACGATFALAQKYSLTLYDAAYLELAKRGAHRLATLDKSLHKAAQAEGVWWESSNN